MEHKFDFGVTFSQLQCGYLGLDAAQTKEAFRQTLGLGVKVVRLGSYWNEIQPAPGKFNFSVLESQLNEIVKGSSKVLLSVGMKAPRWPEYHFPSWVLDRFPDLLSGRGRVGTDPHLSDLVLDFIERVVVETRDCPNITSYQIENEPLVKVPFALSRNISLELLEKEVQLANSLRRLDQKTLINIQANPIPVPIPGYDDGLQFRRSLELADAIGFDIYDKIPLDTFLQLPPFKGRYIGPLRGYFWNKLAKWSLELERLGKEAWVTESQAEPWETGNFIHTAQREYPSSNPKRARFLATWLGVVGFNPILLWGVEYWYWHKLQGHMEWWSQMEELISGDP